MLNRGRLNRGGLVEGLKNHRVMTAAPATASGPLVYDTFTADGTQYDLVTAVATTDATEYTLHGTVCDSAGNDYGLQ